MYRIHIQRERHITGTKKDNSILDLNYIYQNQPTATIS